MEIDWWTLGLQAVNFAVLVWLLRRFLYAPVRQVIEKRRAEAGAALQRAEDARAAAEAERQGLADDRARLEAGRLGVLTAARDEGAAERAAILARARVEADEVVRTGRDVIAAERRTAIAGAEAELAALAATLARHILDEAAAGDLADRVAQRIAALPDEERARLDAALAAPGAGIRVLTAAPLAAADVAHWRDRLGGLFNGATVDFGADPALLGGAALAFPHSVLNYSWAEQLTQAREAIEGNGRI